MIFFIILIVLAIVLVSTCVKIVPQAHSFVIERLGVYKEHGQWDFISKFHFWIEYQEKLI
jgi:regulator of protease activity HflC (stomatin/prohibitin superfamily)